MRVQIHGEIAPNHWIMLIEMDQESYQRGANCLNKIFANMPGLTVAVDQLASSDLVPTGKTMMSYGPATEAMLYNLHSIWQNLILTLDLDPHAAACGWHIFVALGRASMVRIVAVLA